MTITFETDRDVIVYALEKIISFARENRYFFVANCAWWIASIIGLDSELKSHIDNLVSRIPVSQERAISATPRDIARDISPETQSSSYISDPLRRTRKGRIQPIYQSKTQLKKALNINRQAQPIYKSKTQFKKARQAERQRIRLEEKRAQIIQDLMKD
jgi:hypothetical protein